MSPSRSFVVALAAVMAAALAGPVAGAAANGKGIKHALKTFEGRVLAAENHVVAVEKTYLRKGAKLLG